MTISLIVEMVLFLPSLTCSQTDTSNSLQPIIPIPIKLIEKGSIGSSDLLIKNTTSVPKYFQTITLIKKIQDNSNQNIVTQKLYGLFFRKQDMLEAGKIINKTDAIEKFKKFAGKEINRVDIIKLEPFGQSIFDSTIQPTRWIEKNANRIHLNTSSYIIRNNLLFKTGDKVNPVDFSESEELIRNLQFMEDVNIIITPLSDSNLVNVKVFAKDTWSIAAGYEMSSTTSGELHLYDKNLGGLGLGLHAYLYNDSRNPNDWGHKAELNVPNIMGSFIKGDIAIRQGLGYDTYSLNLKRDFYSSSAKNGWGARLIKSAEPYTFKAVDSTDNIQFTLYDYWIGRSFRVSRKNYLKPAHNLVISFRYLNKHFDKRPSVQERENFTFHNSEYFLVGLSMSQQKLFKENLIYSFGSTEDIPIGFRIQFNSGYEISEFRKRIYINGEMSAAEVGPWGYLFLSARAGTYFGEKSEMQQSVINIRSSYFTNLLSIKNQKIRQFIKVDYTRGFGRFSGEGDLVLLENSHGIRGLSSREMIGTSRLLFSLETVKFSDLFFYGFRFAYFLFCDVGFIGSSDYIVGNDVYNGFGVGIRIRNEHLVFRTFLIRLGYYPLVPDNPDINWWSVNGEQKTPFNNFRPREPQILSFE